MGKLRMLFALMLIFEVHSCVFLASQALAADYYIDYESGSDANLGTILPFPEPTYLYFPDLLLSNNDKTLRTIACKSFIESTKRLPRLKPTDPFFCRRPFAFKSNLGAVQGNNPKRKE